MDVSAARGSVGAVRTILIAALLFAAFALAIALRLRQSTSPMVFDEYAAMYFSHRPWGDLWGWWILRETNPPLFYSVLKLWRGVVPASEAALRLLPLLLSLAQIALLARLAGRTYGGFAAVLCILLFALGPSDIYQSEYVRGYVLAKLAVTVSFVGLLHALEDGPTARRGWIAYVAGAVVAIYSHTTMLLWPPIATLAVLVEWAVAHGITRRRIATLLLTNAAIVVLSGWVLLVALLQLRAHAGNIAWIEPLSLEDYAATIDLQLLLDAPASSIAMGLLILVGLVRTWRSRTTRVALIVTVGALAAYKLADQVHPITSDFTLHWCATFTVLLASAALADWKDKRGVEATVAVGVVAAITAVGLYQLETEVMIPRPQDYRQTIRTVAHTPGGALLASHESIGVTITQACRLEFGGTGCPFPLVVLANSAKSDAWAAGGYGRPLTPIPQARAALDNARTVYAFSRYVYTPLAQLGMDEGKYPHVEWDDGELIGPIPISDVPAETPNGLKGWQ